MSAEQLPAPGFYWARKQNQPWQPVEIDHKGWVSTVGNGSSERVELFEIGGALPPPAD